MGLDEKGESWVTEGAFYFSNGPWPPSDVHLLPVIRKSPSYRLRRFAVFPVHLAGMSGKAT
jgi:hypothetical protein